MLTALTAVSVVLGYVREGVVAYYFGTSGVVDAFYVAFTLPKLLVALVTNVVVLSLLPVYVEHVRGGAAPEARLLARRALSLLAASLAVLATVVALAPEITITLLAPGFDPERTAEAARLLRGLLPYTVLASLASVYKMVLDSHQRFGAPAVARALVTVTLIVAMAAGAARFGIWALVGGYAAGSALMLALHVWGARGLATAPRLGDAFSRPSIVGLPLAGVGWVGLQLMMGQVFPLADRVFASGLAEGSIAALNYSTAIVTAPQNFVTSVLATVLFPVLARSVADGRPQAALRVAGRWLAVIWLATAPLIALLIVFRTEIVSLLFERGAFDRDSTGLVASVLSVAPLTIAIGGGNAILNRLLLARRNYRFTAGLAGFTGVVKVALNALLVGPLGVVGLALASVLAAAVSMIIRLVYLWRYGPALGRNATPPVRPAPPLDL